MRVGEYLEVKPVEGKKSFTCVKCGHVFCSVKENYKLHVSMREVPLASAGQKYPRPEDTPFVFREFCCSGCGVRLDVEVAEPGSPVTWDIQLSV